MARQVPCERQGQMRFRRRHCHFQKKLRRADKNIFGDLPKQSRVNKGLSAMEMPHAHRCKNRKNLYFSFNCFHGDDIIRDHFA